MELSERKLQILQAIVADFIYSAEPVGSRTLSRKYDMGISPATIRNEMSDLEEMGYLSHPHTSAGRVPSDKAYRLYVNQMMNDYEVSAEEKAIITEKLTKNVRELERTVHYAATLLSELTNLASFAITPNRVDNTLKYVNFLPVDERTVVLMIIGQDGKVSSTNIRLEHPYTAENLELMSKVMTHNFKGKTINDILTIDIVKAFENDMFALHDFAQRIAPDFLDTLERLLSVDLYMEGLTNIFSIPEYNDIDKARCFIEMVQQKQQFTEVLVNRDNGLIITIGSENAKDYMKDCSLITADYRIDGRLVGKLGVIGPTRMKYGEITSVIKYMTDNISQTFQLKGEEKDE
ncbi:MAG TPA: heat-inducible transcriptional repressor HrcA [Bacillota bacterium]|nr:heat-inducible transcriptional repressor HrcA [Bacillota bacterium]